MICWIYYTICLLGFLSLSKGCDVYTAQEGVTGSFDSHDLYQNASYSHNTFVCWIINTDPGYAIAGWTSDDFHLETGYDGLHIMCGHDGEDGYIDSYTGEHGISSSYPVYTVATEMYLVLYTDWSVSENGFRFFFTAVNDTEAGDGDCGEYPEESEEDESDEVIHKYSGGYVAGIVFAVLLLLAFLGIVAACVVCFVCSIKTRPKRIVGDYPMGMYPGMTPVGAPQHGVHQPPAYTGAAGPFSTPPQQQLYGEEQKVHPDHINPNGTFSPPPSYEPQTTGHA